MTSCTSILTGFILGSVSILWPWQQAEFLLDAGGHYILKDGEKVITHYSRYLPESFGPEFWIAIACILLGIISIWATEKLAKNNA